MQRLIQDIKPAKRPHNLTTQSVEYRLKQVHNATNIPRLAEHVTSFDIITPRKKLGPKETIVQTNRAVPTPIAKLKKHPKKVITFRRRMLDFIQYPIIAVLALGVAYSLILGEFLILVFLFVALIMKVSSKYGFSSGLFLIICIPFFQAINQTGISQNCAIYAFEMLSVGIVCALFELWRERKDPILYT